MTKIVVITKDRSITSVECDGHTGYGVEGEDIVCASISSIVQTAWLGILQVAAVNVKSELREGYLKLELPDDLTDKQRSDCDIILNTMLLGVQDLYEGYSDFISLEVK